MKKQLAIFCALALSLLAGCAVTPPSDEAFQRDLADSIEETAEDWARDWEASLEEAARSWSTQDENAVEKDHCWKVLDSKGSEAGTVTDPEQVKPSTPFSAMTAMTRTDWPRTPATRLTATSTASRRP